MLLKVKKYENNLYVIEDLKPLDIQKILPLSKIITIDITSGSDSDRQILYVVKLIKAIKPIKNSCTKVWLGFDNIKTLDKPLLIPEILLNNIKPKATELIDADKILNKVSEYSSISSLCTNFITNIRINKESMIKYIKVILLEELLLVNNIKPRHVCYSVTKNNVINNFIFGEDYNFPTLYALYLK